MRQIFTKHRPLKVPFGNELFNSIFGGYEGGLATTSAIIAGLFVSTYDREVVIITAMISFLVQAFNSAVSRYSNERTNDEIEQIEDVIGIRTPLIDAVVQLVSHVIGAAAVIAPIIFIVNVQFALIASIGITLILLFFNGAIKGYFVKNNPFVEGMEMVILGSLIISVGMIAGLVLRE